LHAISEAEQVIILLVGVVVLGIPHGGADQLIAFKNSSQLNTVFSKKKFILMYWGNIALFSLLLIVFPLIGIGVFLCLAAYHFGETDLQKLHCQTLLGKAYIFQYGLLILGVILLPHFNEVQDGLALLHSGVTIDHSINWISENSEQILIIEMILFIFSSIIYFSINKRHFKRNWMQLIQLTILILLLYKLPLILSFTYYFVVWHAVFSLKNTLLYLSEDKSLSPGSVVKEISKNSIIALLGTFVVGCAGFAYLNNNNLVMYAVLGLAVLTAPHMQILHQMYFHLNKNSKTVTVSQDLTRSSKKEPVSEHATY
jgi:Brp/Blh family beta-carotene 15,15'-monooxygenase